MGSERALIFDFDGTIVDTETPALASVQHVFAHYEADLPMDWWLAGMGTDRKGAWVDELERQVGRPLDMAELMARRQEIKDSITDAQPVMPGVVALIEAAKQAGLALGVASSSAHEWVDRHLARVGLDHHFDVVACRDDVGGVAKPAPDVYIHALASLGVDPSRSAAIEDSPNGASAAIAAGLRCCAVPNPLMVDADFSVATVRVEALHLHDPAHLVSQLTS